MNKKAYIFTLDAAIAVMILIVGFALLYYQFATEKKATYVVERLSQDVIGVLAHTKVTDLCKITTNPDTCECIHYPKLQILACGSGSTESVRFRTADPSILDLFAEVIETGSHPGKDVEEAIHEIFVTNRVIDEKRYGFSVLYTNLGDTPITLELYNTETYPANP